MFNLPKNIETSNTEVVKRILEADPVLIDVKPALDVVPGMEKTLFLHAGPPVKWDNMCAALQGSLIGAILYEGLAQSPEECVRLIETEKVTYEPSQPRQLVNGMAHVTSAHMPLFVVKNQSYGNLAFCPMREAGAGKALRYGVYSTEVLQKLKWVESTLGPAFRDAIKASGGINLKSLMSRAVHMGDDGHSRVIAGTSLFGRIIMPFLIKTGFDKETICQIAQHVATDDLFALSLNMAAAKATMDAAHGIKGSTIVTVMARNGTDFGIKVSGLGDQWFTAPSPPVDGVYFPGFGPNDASKGDMGDSSIIETMGLGAMVAAAAPTMGQLSKSTNPMAEAISLTKAMYEITEARNSNFTIPCLGFSGAPTAINIRKVVETGITPGINTAIAHKQVGFGMIGTGLARAPIECFTKALKAFAKSNPG